MPHVKVIHYWLQMRKHKLVGNLTAKFADYAKRLGAFHSRILRGLRLKYPGFLGWPVFGYVPLLAMLLFLGAMLWAKAQDPFSRLWFTLKTADHGTFQCVAVLPKPVRRCPVVVYVHDLGGSLMTDGKDLRQMAEMGLVAVSLDYDKTNEATFNAQWSALLQYVGRQPWADTNAVAWVGFGLGSTRAWEFAQQNVGSEILSRSSRRGDEAQIERKSEPPYVGCYEPQLLVLISGEGILASGLPKAGTRPPATEAGALPLSCPVLLVHGEQDEAYPVAATQSLAARLQTNGVPVTLHVLPGLSHGLDPERAVVFRGVG